MRQYVSILLSIILLGGAIFAAYTIVGQEKKTRPLPKKVVQTAYVEPVINGSIPIHIKESGRLVSKNRVEVYAEVQGVMETTTKEFKPGTHYRTGEIMVKIRSNDYYANLQAQKSVLQNLITSVLPDLRLDYPDTYKKWDDYLKNFDMDKPIGKLPETSSEKEKFFITGKNIYTTYYNTKNLEIILRKYTLRAPFKGILTDALVTPGTVVRPGQKLGEYIDPSIYELEVAISKSMLSDLSIGKNVVVSNPEGNGETWQGKISRINGRVNTTTQTVKVFIDVSGKDLREGMYMQAIIEGLPKDNAYNVARKLLVDDSNLYVVEDSTLIKVPITILHKTNDSIVVRGLINDSQLLSSPISGAYSGMVVSTKKTN
jgi:membrane fusion protein (multidrug efflux system)